MSRPIQHLPVLQNWDCHVCGTCCKEYVVHVTDEERKRIESQGWDADKDLEGRKPFRRRGWLRRRWTLNHRPDGSCVFLGDNGRCRVHEKFGYAAKPLPCRLFPFVLIPVYDHWSVSLRYACPSAAANKGRPLPQHDRDLAQFAVMLAEREGLKPQPDGSLTRPPALKPGLRVEWPDLLRFVNVLLDLLRNTEIPLERRLRQCLTFAGELRRAKLDGIKGGRLGELLQVMQGVAESETPGDPASLPRPSWIGRVLFRQAAAIFTRKDHGPNRGLAARGRLALLWSAWRFATGWGRLPRMHKAVPEVSFAQLEEPSSMTPSAERVLERYYTMKIGSLQFCGPASFGLPFWEGLESFLLTYPVLRWVMRMFRDQPPEQAAVQALSIVDDHIGFNRVLASMRQRMSFSILARTGQLARLIAWYSR
jgi:lysine-N-methylase